MYKSFLLKRKSIIYNELKSLGLKLSKDSLYLWLDYACNIFLFHKVPKYTRSLVKERSMPAKYYVADVGLYNAVLLSQSEDEGKALENIVCLMIERTLGEDGRVFYFSENNECDFVIQRGDEVSELVQVCWELNDKNYWCPVKLFCVPKIKVGFLAWNPTFFVTFVFVTKPK